MLSSINLLVIGSPSVTALKHFQNEIRNTDTRRYPLPINLPIKIFSKLSIITLDCFKKLNVCGKIEFI